MRQSLVVRVLVLVGSNPLALLGILVLVQKVGVVLAVVRECDRAVAVVVVKVFNLSDLNAKNKSDRFLISSRL